MKLTSEMISRAITLADDLSLDYEIVGIRVQDKPFELGEVSHVWDDGEDTGEELDGVCAIKFDMAKNSHLYSGDHVAVLAGNRYSFGEDPGEIIIEDPVVVEVLA